MSEKPALLLVDDEPDMLASLTGLLRRDFRVHTAQSGDEALAIMAGDDVHVLMTDQRMPGMTGSALLQKVSQQNLATVLILFTGYADIKSVIDAVNTGRLFRYVTKPWDPDELTELLRSAAAEYERRALEQRIRNHAGQWAALGRDVAAQVNDGGHDVDKDALDALVRTCEQLEAQAVQLRSEPTGGGAL